MITVSHPTTNFCWNGVVIRVGCDNNNLGFGSSWDAQMQAML